MTETSVSFAVTSPTTQVRHAERGIARAMFRVVCGRREPEASF